MSTLLDFGVIRAHLYPGEYYFVGSKNTNDERFITLDDELVDEKHAVFKVKNDGRCILLDLSTESGTFVDGQRIPVFEEIYLIDNTIVRLGSTSVKIYMKAQLSHHDSSGFHDSNKNVSDIFCGTPERTVDNNNPKSLDKKENDSFVIPATQQQNVFPPRHNDSLLENINDDDDDDFCIPETQEVAIGSSQRRLRAENAALTTVREEDGSESVHASIGVRICTQDFNAASFEDNSNSSDLLEENLCSLVIPRIKHNTVLLNDSSNITMESQQIDNPVNNISTECHEIPNKEAPEILNVDLTDTATTEVVKRETNCTPDLFILPGLDEMDVQEIEASLIMEPPAVIPPESAIAATSIESVPAVNYLDAFDLMPTQVFPTKSVNDYQLFEAPPALLTSSDKENTTPGTTTVTSATTPPPGPSRNDTHCSPTDYLEKKGRENMDIDDFVPIFPTTTATSLNFNSTLLPAVSDSKETPNAASFFKNVESSLSPTNQINQLEEPNFDLDDIMCTPVQIREVFAGAMCIEAKKKEDNLQTEEIVDSVSPSIIFSKKFCTDFDDLMLHVSKVEEEQSLDTIDNKEMETKTTNNTSKTRKSRSERYVARDEARRNESLQTEQEHKKNTSSSRKSNQRKTKNVSEKNDSKNTTSNKSISNSNTPTTSTSVISTLKPGHEVDNGISSTEKSRKRNRSHNDRKRSVNSSSTSNEHDQQPRLTRNKTSEMRKAKGTEHQKQPSEAKKPSASNTKTESSGSCATNTRSFKYSKNSNDGEKSTERADNNLKRSHRRTKTSATDSAKSAEKPNAVKQNANQKGNKIVEISSNSRKRLHFMNISSQESAIFPLEVPEAGSSSAGKKKKIKSKAMDVKIATEKEKPEVPCRRLTRLRSQMLDIAEESTTSSMLSTKAVAGSIASRSEQDDSQSCDSTAITTSACKRLAKTESQSFKRTEAMEPIASTSRAARVAATNETVKIKIMTSMVEPDHIKELFELSQNKWEITKNPVEAEVLVMNKSNRTFKLLVAIARGIPIVKSEWLKIFSATGNVSDTAEHFFHDPEFEKRYGFNLLLSIEKARKHKLFENMEFLLTPRIVPLPHELKVIITCAGGTVLNKIPDKPNEKLFLVSSHDDKRCWHKYRRHNKHMSIISTESVMAAIMKQNSKALHLHQLD